jgi:hypothetical protein
MNVCVPIVRAKALRRISQRQASRKKEAIDRTEPKAPAASVSLKISLALICGSKEAFCLGIRCL